MSVLVAVCQTHISSTLHRSGGFLQFLDSTFLKTIIWSFKGDHTYFYNENAVLALNTSHGPDL